MKGMYEYKSSDQARATLIPPCPRWLLPSIYFLYLGLATTSSVPLFADIDWMHEGERLGSVQIILDGGLPIRDVYLPHGLFPEIIRPLLAFSIFGESLAADRIFGILLEPLAYVAAAFYVWRVFPAQCWRIAGMVGLALYPVLIEPRHIPVFLTLGLLTAWVYDRRHRNLWVAGAISGLSCVIGTLDQAVFLVAATMLFPFMMAIDRAGVCQNGLTRAEGRCTWREIAPPLFGGLALGLIPFLAYMGWTGTIALFLDDLMKRGEADAYAFVHIWHYPTYPSLSRETLIWYAVPAFYAVLSMTAILRVRLCRERHWIAIVPTVLYGILSLAYAIRAFQYWKLAVVLFPFIVSFVYLLYALSLDQGGQTAGGKEQEVPLPQKMLLIVAGCVMILLLTDSLVRDWGAKQFLPRVLFPVLSLAILTVSVASLAAKRRVSRRGVVVAPACALAALLVGSWFCNDARPQLLSAQLKKPQLVHDVGRLLRSVAEAKLTRDNPPYVQDETLIFLRTSSRDRRRVVMLSPGAGIYYFLSGLSPPNRFPEINVTLADKWAEEVVEGLKRTKADILVACDDDGRSMRGWPIKAILADYLASNYIDSRQRLESQLLGDCPFSVWVHRTPLAHASTRQPGEEST